MITPPALEVTGLCAGYGAEEILRGVDLQVHDGVTSLVGPSGCGKTTLLRAVAGFVRPRAGTIRVAGSDFFGVGTNVPARKRKLGYVPQEGALFPHLTVARNVAFGLKGRDRAAIDKRVAETLALVELDPEMARRMPNQLSGGQQQRVALARALAPGPDLVLLDEPFSSLDASLREETGRAVVRALRASGAAAVLVTHDQEEALSLGNQVAVMDRGVFLQVGTPESVYLRPNGPTVAGFLGSAALLEGNVNESGWGECSLGRVKIPGQTALGPARFAIRPEQLAIAPSAQSGAGGVVSNVNFYGHDATVVVKLSSGEEVTVRSWPHSLPALGDAVKIEVTGEVVTFPL